MESIKLRSHVGKDGILHLDIPVNMKETDLEITVSFNTIKSQDNVSDSDDFNQLDWQEFIARTAGSLAEDESFFRHSQGEYEIREPLV